MDNNINTTRKKMDTTPISPKRSASPARKPKTILKPMSNDMYAIPQYFFDKKNGVQKNEEKIIADAEKKSNLSSQVRGRNIPDDALEPKKSYL